MKNPALPGLLIAVAVTLVLGFGSSASLSIGDPVYASISEHPVLGRFAGPEGARGAVIFAADPERPERLRVDEEVVAGIEGLLRTQREQFGEGPPQLESLRADLEIAAANYEQLVLSGATVGRIERAALERQFLEAQVAHLEAGAGSPALETAALLRGLAAVRPYRAR